MRDSTGVNPLRVSCCPALARPRTPLSNVHPQKPSPSGHSNPPPPPLGAPLRHCCLRGAASDLLPHPPDSPPRRSLLQVFIGGVRRRGGFRKGCRHKSCFLLQSILQYFMQRNGLQWSTNYCILSAVLSATECNVLQYVRSKGCSKHVSSVLSAPKLLLN